jgi:Flp pilus assembly protein TadG
MARRLRGRTRLARARQRGQALVEAAVAFPLLLLTAIGLVQFALFAHAHHVVTGAAQDGARVAAAEDRTVEDGVAHAQAVVRAGLGRTAEEVTVQGTDGGDSVAVEVRGRLRLIIPWATDATLPLEARSTIAKEGFRAGQAH